MTVAGGYMASELLSGTATNHGGEEETQLTLPPAFRFHPTDEEVLLHYFRKRSLSRPVIADVDLNKIEPWDLPGEPKLGVQEWYFFSFKDRKYQTGMRTNRATVSSYWKATGKDKEIISSHRAPHGGKRPWVDVSTPIEHEPGVDVSDGDTRMRLRSTCDVVRDKIGIPLATRLGIAIGCAEALAYMHSSWHPYSIDHTDLKPSNILLDSKMEPNINDFGLSRLLQFKDHTQIPMGSEVPNHNRPLDANFSGKSSAKQDIEIKIGSHMTHRQRYLSVLRHPLIKMLPPVRKWSGDIFASCARLITSHRVFGMPVTGSISAKPKYEIPNAGPVSENIIRKLFGIRKGLTVNESQQRSDASRSDHGKMPVSRKTSASWIIATGAPHHATGNRNLLSGFIMEHDDQFVHAVNRVPMKVLARGAVVTDTLILPDVWFVPGLTENLVSVSQLAELDHAIGFGRGECCIKSARDARIVGVGRLQKGGHYELDFLKVPLAI